MFAGGSATVGGAYADADSSFEGITSYKQGSSGGRYVVRGGETLQSIAQNVWGDAGYWYKLAEANGLSADSTLIEGQNLTLPAGVTRSKNNASTFKPYDASEAIGDTSPTRIKPPKAKKSGLFGMILLAVIAIAVTVITAGAALAALAPASAAITGLGSALTAMASAGGIAGALGGSLAGFVGAVAIGAGSAAIGSIVSQGVGVAAGIQDKFSWKGVAMSALAGGISGGMSGSGLFNGVKSPFIQGALRGVASSAATQEVAVATGLQPKFDWAGVAAAGISGGVSGALTKSLKLQSLADNNSIGNQLAYTGVGMAASIANAATRSLIQGSDFGDNILAGLPDVIGQTIGGLVADRLAGDGKPESVSKPDDTATPQTASGATPASSAVLTDAEKQRRLEAALPDAIAGIKTASTNTALDATELVDLRAAARTLGRTDTRYAYGAIPDQPTAGAGAGMENGRATITINLNSPSLFNTDGTVNMTTLSGFLAHEGRHIYDARFYGQRNGPSTVEEVRRTERNAYRTEAAYLKAVGGTMYTRDLNGAIVPLTSANANVAAENSVKSWVTAAAQSARNANVIIKRNNIQINRYNIDVASYNKSTGNTLPLKSLQTVRPIPVYRPPSSY